MAGEQRERTSEEERAITYEPVGTALTVTDPPAESEGAGLFIPSTKRAIKRGMVLEVGPDVPGKVEKGDVVWYCPCAVYEIRETKIIDASCIRVIEREAN